MSLPRLAFVCALASIAAAPPTPQPLPASFHFAPLDPDRSLSVTHEGTLATRPERWKARMVIGGTLTEGRWPEHPPTVYRIGETRYMLNDTYSGGGGGYYWDASSKKLTPTGYCVLHRMPGAGTVIVRHASPGKAPVEILDFPPYAVKPRVLWTGDNTALAPLGEWDGAVVFVVGGKRLLVLEPGWPAKEIPVDTGTYRFQSTGDGIRRGKVLLLGDMPARRVGGGDYTVALAVFNLKTRELKPIGRIPGGWTFDTAVSHAVVSASWITQEQADKVPKRPPPLSKMFGGAAVVVETEKIAE